MLKEGRRCVGVVGGEWFCEGERRSRGGEVGWELSGERRGVRLKFMRRKV